VPITVNIKTIIIRIKYSRTSKPSHVIKVIVCLITTYRSLWESCCCSSVLRFVITNQSPRCTIIQWEEPISIHSVVISTYSNIYQHCFLHIHSVTERYVKRKVQCSREFSIQPIMSYIILVTSNRLYIRNRRTSILSTIIIVRGCICNIQYYDRILLICNSNRTNSNLHCPTRTINIPHICNWNRRRSNHRSKVWISIRVIYSPIQQWVRINQRIPIRVSYTFTQVM